MQIEMGVQSNCSDATIRIKIDGQDPKKVKALIKELEKRLGEVDDPADKDWNDEESSFDPWSEGYITKKDIFGMNIIEITGDAPYNYSDDILAVIKKYLPKAKIDWTEP